MTGRQHRENRLRGYNCWLTLRDMVSCLISLRIDFTCRHAATYAAARRDSAWGRLALAYLDRRRCIAIGAVLDLTYMHSHSLS